MIRAVLMVILVLAILIDGTLATVEASKGPHCDLPGFQGARSFFSSIMLPLAILVAAMMIMSSGAVSQQALFRRYRW